jgi:signal transduction histidine kinase
MNDRALKLSGAYPHRQLDDLCGELGLVHADRASAPRLLDLTDLKSVAPTALSLLLASIAERYSEVGSDSLAVPSDVSALTWLQEEALEKLMQEKAGHWEDRDGKGTILGALVFSPRMDIYQFLSEVAGHLRARAGLDPDALRAVHFLLFELISNAVKYSAAPRGAVVVELNLPDNWLTVAVADWGIGVRASLSRNPAIETPDDLSALTASLMAARTGDPINGAGMGLFQARWMVQNNGGSFLIRSGDARHERTPAIKNRKGLPKLHGTLVAARLRCDGLLDYGKMDEALRQPEGVGDSPAS